MAKTRRNTKTIPNPGPNQCHPRVGSRRPEAGCFPLSVYQKMAAGAKLPPSRNAITMRRSLEERFGVKPLHEASFLEASNLSEEEKTQLAKQYLRPKMPSAWENDPDKWLDSTNIEQVMKQYEEIDPSFEFMGPFPIDFAAPDPYGRGGGERHCLIEEICDINLPEFFNKGKKKIGIVYNLDPHFKGGSHWIASFVDIPAHKCYYFDSYGMKPPKPIERFMKWLTTQDPKMKLFYNSRRFQFSGSECGMYSLYFIIRMLAGENFRTFCRRAPRDSFMLDLRDWLFSV